MPSLPYVASSYIKRIRDSLSNGPGYASASLALGSGTSAFVITAREAGAAGNNITVQVTVPGGTSGLAVSVSGTAITIALGVSAGVAQAAQNTATLIVAAINASATVSALVEAALVGSGAGSLSVASGPTALSGGVTGAAANNFVNTLPMNFLRAQDMASILDVLQDALDLPAALTATGGTSTSVQDTGAYVANTQIGNTVTFGAATTTVALRNVSAVVVSNTANALFFASALPATPAAGDTYTITGSLVEPIVAKLRDGRGKGDSPAGNEYGDSRLVTDALVRMARQLGGTVSDTQVFAGSTGTGSTTTAVVVSTTVPGNLRIDAFKNKRLVISGETRKIVGNNENTIFFDKPLSSAPAGSTSFTVTDPRDSADATDVGQFTFAPGGQPGNNRRLAELIRICEAAVVAFTLPT